MATNYKGGLKGAATGAAAGSAFGPWGTAIGGGLGGLLGLFGGGDNGEAAAGKQAAFDQSASQLGTLSDSMDARRKAALQQSLAMFGPTNSVLSKMYGPGAVGPGIDIDALFGPPLPDYSNGKPATPPQPYNYFDPPEVQRQIETNLRKSGLNKNDTFKRGTRGKRSGHEPRGYGA